MHLSEHEKFTEMRTAAMNVRVSTGSNLNIDQENQLN